MTTVTHVQIFDNGVLHAYLKHLKDVHRFDD